MEKTINSLLASYEKGHINRRQLVGGLLLLAAGSEASAATNTKAMSINHIAINVSDVKKSSQFYHDVFGMSVTMEDEKSAALLFNNIGLIIRPGKNPGTISHFMMGVDNYDADKMAAELKSHGLEPRKDQDSFHVKDPDGLDVQIGDKDMRGSSQAPAGKQHLTPTAQKKN
jgi:catechol 2,3-dioxygenase-like lactoylglutathione lyase family enzyme